jgi:hypothetical protein
MVDGEDGTNKAFGIFLFLSDREGEMQCCAGESTGEFPKVVFVELECRLVVELIEDVPL